MNENMLIYEELIFPEYPPILSYEIRSYEPIHSLTINEDFYNYNEGSPLHNTAYLKGVSVNEIKQKYNNMSGNDDRNDEKYVLVTLLDQ